MRLFVAISLPDSVRAVIAANLKNFAIAAPPWRWTAPDTWHLTLKFLGETDPASLVNVASALAPVAMASTAYRARLGPFGAFPSFSRPRVLHYALDSGVEETVRLAAAVDETLHRALGIATERRPYRAHATVARVTHPLGPAVSLALSRVPPLSDAEFDVVCIDLMRSHLGPQGSYYERVKQFALPYAK